MPIKHGTYVREEATAVTVPKTGKSSVQVVVGCAPINMVANPASKVNVPILANSAAEAMKELGYVNDVKNFTLCQTMYLSANALKQRPHRSMTSRLRFLKSVSLHPLCPLRAQEILLES